MEQSVDRIYVPSNVRIYTVYTADVGESYVEHTRQKDRTRKKRVKKTRRIGRGRQQNVSGDREKRNKTRLRREDAEGIYTYTGGLT